METLHGTAGTCRWTVRSFALLLLLPLLLLLIPPQTAAAVIFQDCAGVSDGALPAGWMNMPGTSGTASCSGGRIRVVDQDASRQTYCYYASAAFPESGPYTLDFDLLRVAGTARIALGTNSVQTTDFSGASLVQLIFTSDGSIDYFKGSTYHLKNGSAPAGQAVHVRLAGTYDASSQSANLYLDGVLVGTVDGYSWLSRKKSPNRLMLGSSGTTTTGDEFYVDNVRISQSVEPPASFVSSTVTTTAAGEPVSVVHVLSGGGADMDFTHRLYWYDPELDRFAKSYATPAGQADPSSWSVVVRRSGTYQLRTEARLDGGAWLECSQTEQFEVPVRAVTVGVAEREAPEGALRLSVGGGFAGMKTMVWLRRGGDEALGWTLVKEYGDAYEGADGGSSYLDLDPADFAAGSLPAAGEACSVRVETLTDAEYMACTRTATGVHEVSCTVQPADRPAIADARVSSASGRAGSEQPLGETLVRPAGGVLTFRVGSTGFQSEDVDYKLRLVPDAESGQGAAGDGILDADFAAVGSGDRTGTLEWDTSATPSGTYMLSLEAASHSFASSRSASQRCVVTLTRTGETVPELDATTPIRVSRTDRHATATIAGTGLDAVYATLWVSTPFRSIATARGTGAAAASLDLSLPGYGVYRLDATVRRPGLKTYDDAATQYFHWDRADPVRFVGVEARTGGAEGAPWTADLIVSPGTAVRFTATAVGGGGTAGSPQDLAAGYEYSFWTEDAGDWHQLRGWSTDPAWTYTPTDSGSYSVVAFARGADGLAGSYEAAWSTTLVVSGAPDLGGYRLVKGLGLSAKGIGATGAEEGGDGALAGLVARTPVRLSVEVDPTAKDAQGNLLASAALPERRLYRFEVIDDHLYTTLRGFSSDPTCLWIPRKPGTYRILVHIRDAKSGGFEDVHTVAEDVSVG